jgi:hypothetical protein
MHRCHALRGRLFRSAPAVLITLACAGLVAVIASAQQGIPNAGAGQKPPAVDPARLYQLFEEREIKTVEFATLEWGYHVEAPSKEKLYIAGVKGPTTDAAASAAFARTPGTPSRPADLMIVVCGQKFGDDPCDFYSALHQVPHNGQAIQPDAIAQYQLIIDAARSAIDPAARGRRGARPAATPTPAHVDLNAVPRQNR